MEIIIKPHGNRNTLAWVDDDDLAAGVDRIYIGTELDEADSYLQACYTLKPHFRPYTAYKNPHEMIYEDYIETVLTHETLHIVLYNIAGHSALKRFDNIDTCFEISRG